MNRRWVGISIMAAAAMGVALIAYRSLSERKHQGKRVIEWALELNGPQDTAPATRFFLQAKPDIVPVLGRALSEEESLGRHTVLSIGRRLPDRMRARLYQLVNPYERDQRRIAAAYALELMGTNAISALPELSEAIHDLHPAVRFRAARALGRIGKPALPALIAAIKEGASLAQVAAMQGLSMVGGDAAEAIPTLIKALELPAARIDACNTLVEIGRPSVLPLCGALRHTNSVVQSLALSALARIGPLARVGIPELTKSLDDPSPAVRSAATQAIAAIQNGWPNQ